MSSARGNKLKRRGRDKDNDNGSVTHTDSSQVILRHMEQHMS
jgi:hypothetical protein